MQEPLGGAPDQQPAWAVCPRVPTTIRSARSRMGSVVTPGRVWEIADDRIEQVVEAPAHATARAGTFETSAFYR